MYKGARHRLAIDVKVVGVQDLHSAVRDALRAAGGARSEPTATLRLLQTQHYSRTEPSGCVMVTVFTYGSSAMNTSFCEKPSQALSVRWYSDTAVVLVCSSIMTRHLLQARHTLQSVQLPHECIPRSRGMVCVWNKAYAGG